MKNNSLLKLGMAFVPFVCSPALSISAEPQQDSDNDILQFDLRVNPLLEELSALSDSLSIANNDFSEYPFLNLDANYIELNGADWSDLREKFAQARKKRVGDNTDSRTFSIVHLGDSHLQADFCTEVVRNKINKNVEVAGSRGLIIPFKLAGTNQPVDYTIGISAKYESSRLLKRPWKTKMGFTGIGVEPLTKDYTLKIEAKEQFDSIRVLYLGKAPTVSNIASNLENQRFSVTAMENVLSMKTSKLLTSADITFIEGDKTTIEGIELINSKSNGGVLYHVIGNNGAEYNSYSGIDNFGNRISSLSPDLFIISLGTNEAFGKITAKQMYESIDNLVKDIQRNNPNTVLLLTTPSQCYRQAYFKQRKGKKTRRVAKHVVNQKIDEMRTVICEYARQNGIALYDWFAVAGGENSAAAWDEKELFAKDKVHFKKEAYQINGHLTADALLKALKK